MVWISPFWCGVIVGAAVELTLLIIASVWYSKRKGGGKSDAEAAAALRWAIIQPERR